MGNQGWTNQGSDGVHTSSTDRQSGRGTDCTAGVPFLKGTQIAHPTGGDNDPLSGVGDLLQIDGGPETTPLIYRSDKP